MATLKYCTFVGTTTSNKLEMPYDAATLVIQIKDTASGTTIDLKAQGTITPNGDMADLIPEGAQSADMEAEGIFRFDARGLRQVQISGDTADLSVEAVVTS